MIQAHIGQVLKYVPRLLHVDFVEIQISRKKSRSEARTNDFNDPQGSGTVYLRVRYIRLKTTRLAHAFSIAKHSAANAITPTMPQPARRMDSGSTRDASNPTKAAAAKAATYRLPGDPYSTSAWHPVHTDAPRGTSVRQCEQTRLGICWIRKKRVSGNARRTYCRGIAPSDTVRDQHCHNIESRHYRRNSKVRRLSSRRCLKSGTTADSLFPKPMVTARVTVSRSRAV